MKKSIKAQAALALAVSLWIATGGMASAENSGGAKSGNYYRGNNGLENNEVNYDTTDNTIYHVEGAYAQANNQTATNNKVTIGGNVDLGVGHVVGAYLHGKGVHADGNTVIINNSGTINDVYGGYALGGEEATYGTSTASGNTVTINGGTIKQSVVGGYFWNGGTAAGNTITLNGATVGNSVYGGYSNNGTLTCSGNVLILSGTNTVERNVKNFETIKLSENLAWDTTKTVLTLTKGNFENCGKLDVSAVTTKATTPGTMTLLKAAKNALPTFALSTGETVTAAGVIVKEQSSTESGVTLSYARHTVALGNDNKTVTYTFAGNNAVSSIAFGEMTWGAGRTVTGYDFANVGTIDATNLKFTNPEDVTGNMTLLAGATNLATIAETEKNFSYAYSPVAGVMLNGEINGSYKSDSTNIVYTATANKADKLTFTNVEWKDSGALIDHATDATKNIDFNGAAVDTSNINFTNISELDANKKMTLVSDFGNTVGTITGTKYKVGSTLQGTGKASLVDSDGDGTDDALIFTAETKAEKMTVQEQTHNTVMGAEAGMAALSAGNDFIGAATEGLALASNVGADGISSFAKMGGGTMRQETGSHVDTHTWNAILALGHQNKKERGTFEYGAFFEYGSGNYTTHNGNERGDGSARYTGGGLLAKYTAKSGMYVEGSLRAGTVHDDARNVLRDAFGNPYSYETNANYFGGHVGVGKEITLNNGNVVDVYGKYFYNRRNGVDFNAGGHYDLDAVTSSVLRVGARYIMKRNKWNFYAGAAYEHEFDGKAGGTADGVAIRGADTSGASFRGELGATMKPGENSPWSLDLNVSGFAGKKQGFTGGVSVAFMF